jgi:hypothetical protein
MTLLAKYSVISSSGKSVCSIFFEHDVAVAIVARKRSGSVGMYGELPDLKFLVGDSLVVKLNDRDFIEKPIRPAVLGNMLHAVAIKNVAVDRMPIPAFAAAECARSLSLSVFVVMICASFLEVAPKDGAREATRTAALKAQSHRQT